MRWHILILVTVCSLATNVAQAGDYVPYRPSSILDRFLDAKIIVVGRMKNAVEPNKKLPDGQTELVFDEIVKPDNVLKDRKSIIMLRFILSEKKFLVSLYEENGKIDAHHGIPLDANGAILKYLRGAMQLKDKSKQARVRYNVDFLSDPCDEVAASAHIELRNASYQDVRKIAETLKPEPLAKALRDTEAKSDERGTFALLLGHCGNKKHAAAIRELLDEYDAKKTSNWRQLPNLFFAYVLLDTETAWDYLARNSVDTEKNSFVRRYFGLKAIRQLATDRPDVIDRKNLDAAMLAILGVNDICDIVIEDFRKAKRWDHCDAVLDVFQKPSFKAPIIKNAVLRYALQCPSARAKAFVNEQRMRDAKWVNEETQVLLDDESAPK